MDIIGTLLRTILSLPLDLRDEDGLSLVGTMIAVLVIAAVVVAAVIALLIPGGGD